MQNWLQQTEGDRFWLFSRSPGHWSALEHWETSVRVSLRKLFHSRFVCSQHTAPRNIKFAHTPPSQRTVSHASEIHLMCSEKFALGQWRIRTSDLSICGRTRYHWTNAPKSYYCINTIEKNQKIFTHSFTFTSQMVLKKDL